jgi:pimeloyl-ACP methyl ester carboxylesterase
MVHPIIPRAAVAERALQKTQARMTGTIGAVEQPGILATYEWPPSTPAPGARARVAVLVHGITGWRRTWWRVGPALADRGWRVIAFDLRGHGLSPRIEGVATGQTLAADLANTLASLHLVHLDLLLAHSLGAAVAMELVRRLPEVARRLVLEDPPGQSRADDLEYQATLEREVIAAREDPEAEVRRELAENPDWLPEDARQDVEGRALCDLDGILASVRHDLGLRVVELAPTIGIPTLYLLADVDRSVLGDRRSALIGELPPQAAVVEFDAGHTIHRDRFVPYIAAVDRWLAR